MKNFQFSLRTIIWVSAGLLFTSACQKEHAHDHEHYHTDYNPDFRHVRNILFPTPTPDRIILNLTEDASTSMAVNWRTDTTVTAGVVEVAVAGHGSDFDDSARTIVAATERLDHQHDDEPMVYAHYHSAVMDNLQPNTRYAYRVGQGEVWSEWIQFTTAGTVEDEVSFIYFGDAQNDVKSMWSRVIREAYTTLPKVDFMLHAGDLINRHDRDLEWGEWFYAGSFIHSMVPSVMTPGNHEYKDVVLSPQWRPQFNLPTNGPAGLEEVCYFADYQDLRVISLDAEQIDESEQYREAQKVWLDSVLSNNPKKWTAITFHYPVFSTKPNRDNKELREHFKPIFDKYKVDIVLQGHDHAYGRGMVNNVPTGFSLNDKVSGTMYVVSVSGPKMYDVSEDSWMDRRAKNTQLFQIISIKGDTLKFEAYTAAGQLYDAFDLVKQPEASNNLINRIPEFKERIK
ncbi:metallophosphoesterase family protein [Flammeovirgaceae bacterium SG7u.111]|nr:metallophosphoesterase family protein [Flammeovirgaceae bacterium SG7u.132]WPO33241.1 metallophosphoesterase family protein [Flammeovirgaceae bacterium SG7u.111]